MKNMVKCPNWNDYEGLNGTVSFCGAGAYGRKLKVEEARSLGCSGLKREKCMEMMIASGGFGLVPEIISAVPAGTEMAKRGEYLGMVG